MTTSPGYPAAGRTHRKPAHPSGCFLDSIAIQSVDGHSYPATISPSRGGRFQSSQSFSDRGKGFSEIVLIAAVELHLPCPVGFFRRSRGTPPTSAQRVQPVALTTSVNLQSPSSDASMYPSLRSSAMMLDSQSFLKRSLEKPTTDGNRPSGDFSDNRGQEIQHSSPFWFTQDP